MLDLLFSLVLRLPRFRGKARLLGFFRGKLRWTYFHPIVDGLLMRIHPGEWAQFELLRGHILELKTLALYRELLRTGDTYVDVGAHLGFHSLVARQCVGESGRVLAVEPQPYNCDSILENARLNGFSNIAVQVCAVGDRMDFVSLPLQPENDRTVLSLLGPVAGENAAAPVYFRVPVVPLDLVFEQHHIANVKLLKIDVEGYEAAVLDGMAGVADRIDNIVLEILPLSSARSNALDVFERLKTFGFTDWRRVNGSTVKPNEELIDNNLWAARPKTSVVGGDKS